MGEKISMLKKYLLTPGPTQVPETVLLEMAIPMMHHRTSEFESIFSEVRQGLKTVFKTDNDVLILLGSGTLAMEAAVINTLNDGDTALVINGGKFAERWTQLCKMAGINVIELKIEWGEAVDPQDVKKILDETPNIKAVLMQGSETSTTVYHPIKEVAEIINDRDNTILVVDGITSVGVHDTETDRWGVDILISGSQKAFMLPPGLSFISLSKKAWSMVDKNSQKKFYIDLKKERKNQEKNTTAWTAGVSLIIGLNKVLKMLLEEGLDNVFNRHKVNALATRSACTAIGLKLLAEKSPSDAVTGCYLPAEVDGKAFVKYLRTKCGVAVAGGQDQLDGKVLRISHLGYHDLFDTITAISSIEMGLIKFGADISLSAGVKAAQEIFIKYIPEK